MCLDNSDQPFQNNDIHTALTDQVRDELFKQLAKVPDEAAGLLKAVNDGLVGKRKDCRCNHALFCEEHASVGFIRIIARLRGDDSVCMSERLNMSAPNQILERWFSSIQYGNGPDDNNFSKLLAKWINEFILDVKSQGEYFKRGKLDDIPKDWADAVGSCSSCGFILSCYDKLYTNEGALKCDACADKNNAVLIDVLKLPNNIMGEDCFSMPVAFNGKRYDAVCGYGLDSFSLNEDGYKKGAYEKENDELAGLIGWGAVLGVLKVSWAVYFHGVLD